MANERTPECVGGPREEKCEHKTGQTCSNVDAERKCNSDVDLNGENDTRVGENSENTENSEEAENYVRNVMRQNVVTVSASSDIIPSSQPLQPLQPLETPVRTGKKRHLSMPNIQESKIKKVKANEESDSENKRKDKGRDNSENKHCDGEESKQERVTLRVRRSILPNKERLKVTKGKDKKACSRTEGGNWPQNKSKPTGDNSKKVKETKQNKDTKTKEMAKTVNKSEAEDKFKNTSDTSVILKALDSMKSGLENKIDNINKKNNEKLEKLQSEMNSIRTDFNHRLEGLAKKVELRVIKAVENDTKEKLKKLEKDIRRDMDKMKRNMDRTETEVKRLSQTDLPTVQERLGDEIDSITERVAALERKKTEACKHDDKEKLDDRKRRIVIRNLKERENENVKDQVINIIDYLKVRDVSVEAAERKVNNYNSKPGVIIATFYTCEDKEQVMQL